MPVPTLHYCSLHPLQAIRLLRPRQSVSMVSYNHAQWLLLYSVGMDIRLEEKIKNSGKSAGIGAYRSIRAAAKDTNWPLVGP